MGLDSTIALRFIRYRKKYPFKNKREILKIYGFDTLIYSRIKDSMRIHPVKKKKQYDLNTIYASTLIKNYGLDEKIAHRFVRYRRYLGGFYSVNQLYEVRNLDTSLIEKLIVELPLDTSKIKHFNINAEKIYHPYFSRTARDKLNRYRLSHNDFSSLEEVENSGIFSPAEWKKIKPYIGFKDTSD